MCSSNCINRHFSVPYLVGFVVSLGPFHAPGFSTAFDYVISGSNFSNQLPSYCCFSSEGIYFGCQYQIMDIFTQSNYLVETKFPRSMRIVNNQEQKLSESWFQ
jgi:hypothetical protein